MSAHLLSKLKASQLLPAYLDATFLDRRLLSILAILCPSFIYSSLPSQTQIPVK